MSDLVLVVLLAVLVFVVRIAGLSAGDLTMPQSGERALRFAPVAIIAALTTSLLFGQSTHDPYRLVAALGAAGVMYVTRRIWLCILSGFILYSVLRTVSG